MAIAEVILRIKDESSKTIQQLTATSEGYDAVLKQVADAEAKVEAAERSRAAALGLTVTQMRQVDDALKSQLASEKAAADAAQKAAEANKQFAATAQQRNMPQIPGEVIGAIDDASEAMEGLDKANWQAVQGGQSLKKNLGDVASSLMAGMSPMQVFTQQAGQTADALFMGGDAVAVLKSAFGAFIPVATLLASTATILAGAFIAVTGVIDDYTAASDRAKHAQDSLKEGMKPIKEALADARKEQQLLNDALASDKPAAYLKVAAMSADVDKKEAEATAALRAEQQALLAQLADNRFEASVDGRIARKRYDQITETIGQIHSEANELARLTVTNDTVRTHIEKLSAADEKAAREAEKNAKDRTKAAKDEAAERLKYMQSVNDAYQRMVSAQKVLSDAIISNDPLAQENERYQNYTDSIRAATDALAAQAVHEGNLAEATRIRMEGLKALDAARLQHFQNTGAQGATNDAFLYDQGLGGPSTPVAAPTKQGITAAQGLEAATSLSSLVKLDPTGIASGVYAGMKAAVDIGKGGGALGELKTLLDDLGSALPGLAGGIGDLVEGIISDSIPSLLDGATNALATLPGDLIDGLLDGIPDVIGALAKDAPRLITEMVTLQPRVASALIAAILSPSTWVDAAKALADGLGDGLESAWSDLGTVTQDIGKGLETGVEFLVRSAGSLYGGLSSLFSVDTWKTIGDEIADSLKDLFGGLFGREDKTGLFQKNGAISKAGESVGDWFTQAGKTVGRWFDKGLVGSFDVGSDYVSRTGIAVVHQGEMIVPAHGATQAAAQDRMGNGRGNTYILNGVIAASTEELVRHLREAERMGVSIG